MKVTEIKIEPVRETGRADGQVIDRTDGGETERLTIEEAFVQLEQLVAQLETGEASLEQSFALYQRGMKLVRLCGQKIDKVEKQLIITGESEETDGF